LRLKNFDQRILIGAVQPMRPLVIDEIALAVGFKASANPVFGFEHGERQACLLKTLASGQP